MIYLNRFRKKPAISKFDQLFTPNHTLSQNFATFTSTVLNLCVVRSLSFGFNFLNFFNFYDLFRDLTLIAGSLKKKTCYFMMQKALKKKNLQDSINYYI